MNKDKIRELIATKYKEHYEDDGSMFSMLVDYLLEQDVIDEDVILDGIADITRIAASTHSALKAIADKWNKLME